MEEFESKDQDIETSEEKKEEKRKKKTTTEKTNMRMCALFAEDRKVRQGRCLSFPIIFLFAVTACTRPWTPSASLITWEC